MSLAQQKGVKISYLFSVVWKDCTLAGVGIIYLVVGILSILYNPVRTQDNIAVHSRVEWHLSNSEQYAPFINQKKKDLDRYANLAA